MNTHRLHPLALVLLAPLCLGAKGDGCSANSRSPAPDVEGEWDITYDDSLDVEITIGGATYTESLGVQGGVFSITHDGQPIEFDLNCSRPEVVCPSEAWPATVSVEQRNEALEHRMIVTLPTQSCDGNLVAPDMAECGVGTNNPDCEMVCDGDVVVTNQERFGVIGESGETFRLFLGAGVASNGINCILLGASVADANLDTTGTAEDGDWVASGMSAGLVTTAYAGGCLWAADVTPDPGLEALVLGASVKFTTGFTGQKR